MTCGTATSYTKQGCRCQACRTAGTMQRKRHLVTVARTGPLRVAADPTRQHVAWLCAHGWTLAAVSAATGVSRQALSDLRNRRQVTRATADAVARLVEQARADQTAPAGRRSWPIGPLLDAIGRAGLSQQEVERRIGRQVRWTRPVVSDTTAELVAVKALGLVPALIWTDGEQAA